jgi:hypothetical protein
VYKFKVQARNAFGDSLYSESIDLLCATKPAVPLAPTTTTVNDQVVISWAEPDDMGSPITNYKVFIRQANHVFTQEQVYCEERSQLILSLKACTVPLSVIRSSPYNLLLGYEIYAQVQAENFYGISGKSAEGNNALV